MNWKLIFQLSLFALVMAFATVFLIPPNVEPAFWLPIFLLCAYVIAKRVPAGRFVHGVALGLVNCVWITSAHIYFYDRYVYGHPQEAALLVSMPTHHHRTVMAIMGTMVGLVSGAVIGILALVAGKLVKAPAVPNKSAA